MLQIANIGKVRAAKRKAASFDLSSEEKSRVSKISSPHLNQDLSKKIQLTAHATTLQQFIINHKF